jgi:hypothetical protein
MQYLEVTLNDLQQAFELARSKPRHLVPQPRVSSAPLREGLVTGEVPPSTHIDDYGVSRDLTIRRCPTTT